MVTIDDALMGITDVIRGDDHLSNTPKQIVLYKALNFKIPNFFHVPMILNEEGQKLSKRHGATNVMDYQERGYLKEALVNFWDGAIKIKKFLACKNYWNVLTLKI